MKRRGFPFLVLVLLAVIILPLRAQEEEEEEEPEEGTDIPIESDWSGSMPSIYSAGDRTFCISAGMIFPTVFFNDSGKITSNVGFGGTGFLSFQYFLTSRIFVGAELGGMFVPTISKNMFFMVPMGFRIGYQFVISRFEFPLSILIGGAPQRYIEEGYFGLIIKPMASVFFRFNPDWSFGLNAAWWWTPQWPKSGESMYGNFLELTLSAAYHF
ncbi:MAG: hypothetical protein LBP76_00240 [Treponema sp.]|jgi:hypothetical protein|nr:hypothetical protein [Treponema sp.]